MRKHACICLLAMHTLICVTFSLLPGVSGWLRLLLVALPGLFCVPLCRSVSRGGGEEVHHKPHTWVNSYRDAGFSRGSVFHNLRTWQIHAKG